MSLRKAIASSLSAKLHIAHQRRYSHLAASMSAGSFAEYSADTPMNLTRATGLTALSIHRFHLNRAVAEAAWLTKSRLRRTRGGSRPLKPASA